MASKFLFLILIPLWVHLGLIAEETYTQLPANPVDLEKFIQDFVLESRQLIVPEIPDAFNPSIVRWKGQLWMSFRELVSPLTEIHSAANSHLYIVKLDDNFNISGKPQRLPLGYGKCGYLNEDGRLICVGTRLYIVYSSNRNDFITDGGFRMYISELTYDDGVFQVISDECLSDFDGEDPNVREKNWIPFAYEDHLLLAYSLTPHKIFYPLLNGSGRAEMYVKTKPSIVWEWGWLRGGTPALRFNEDYYLSFFHSCVNLTSVHSEGASALHYFMGAYLFESQPPYKIRKVSPEPIVGKNFYNGNQYEPYWKPVNVVFPGGLVIDEEFVWVSYGRQDHEMWIAKFDKQKLFESLIRVTTIK